eukprot:g30347.t1
MVSHEVAGRDWQHHGFTDVRSRTLQRGTDVAIECGCGWSTVRAGIAAVVVSVEVVAVVSGKTLQQCGQSRRLAAMRPGVPDG